MDTIVFPAMTAEPASRPSVGRWRRVVHFARTVLAAMRERRAEFARCTSAATAYRAEAMHLPVNVRPRGVYPSHRAPRVRRTRSAPRAPREARHTPGPGRQRYALPPDWLVKRFEMSHRMAWARPTVAEILAGV